MRRPHPLCPGEKPAPRLLRSWIALHCARSRTSREFRLDSNAARDAAGLLVEFQSADEPIVATWRKWQRKPSVGLKLCEPAQFTHVAGEQALLWQIRAGMFPSVGSVRKSGTTVIIEDVAFPVEALADAAHDLTNLFRARLRQRHHLRPRQGRQPALCHHPESSTLRPPSTSIRTLSMTL